MTTITLIIPDTALPAWQARLKQFNDGSGQAPVTLEQLKQLELDEETARYEAAHLSNMRALMTPVADAIIVAADGNLAALTNAVEIGKQAALEALA